jgi:hypothetical protein
MKGLMIVIVSLVLGGCVSASTSNKLCADFNIINKVVGAINENAGQAVAEYTPKKCVNAAVSADAGKLTGGVSAGVSNE